VADRPIEERVPGVIAPPPLIYLGPLLAGLALDRFLPLPRLPAVLRGAGPPTALVEKGPFRFTRNPAYLGFALVYAGISLLAGGRWPLVFLAAVLGAIDRGVIGREEAYLQQRFGAPHRDYRSRVRRWL
jgi:protein-S-isoprenylcysteine O-methyltransferase Ste14